MKSTTIDTAFHHNDIVLIHEAFYNKYREMIVMNEDCGLYFCAPFISILDIKIPLFWKGKYYASFPDMKLKTEVKK